MLDIGINEFAWQWSRVKPGDEPRDNVMVMIVWDQYPEHDYIKPFVVEYPRALVETRKEHVLVNVYRGKDRKFASHGTFKYVNAAVFTCRPTTPGGKTFDPAILCATKTENFVRPDEVK